MNNRELEKTEVTCSCGSYLPLLAFPSEHEWELTYAKKTIYNYKNKNAE